MVVGNRLASWERTSKVLQQLDLAQRTLGENLLAEDIGDLFDGDALLGGVVLRGAVVEVVSR